MPRIPKASLASDAAFCSVRIRNLVRSPRWLFVEMAIPTESSLSFIRASDLEEPEPGLLSETVCSAPGKVLVAGGYLILERPNTGMVLALSARFYSSVRLLSAPPRAWEII